MGQVVPRQPRAVISPALAGLARGRESWRLATALVRRRGRDAVDRMGTGERSSGDAAGGRRRSAADRLSGSRHGLRFEKKLIQESQHALPHVPRFKMPGGVPNQLPAPGNAGLGIHLLEFGIDTIQSGWRRQPVE